MSDAKKCDRCGRFYDIYGNVDNAVSFRFVSRWDTTLQPIYDLCPDCMEELKNWLANRQTQCTKYYIHMPISHILTQVTVLWIFLQWI